MRQRQLILVASIVWVLLTQTAWAEDRAKRTLRHSTDITQFNKTSILELVQSPPSAAEIVSVTDVKINSTETGIEIILVTTQSDRLQISTSNEGNVYTAIVQSAQLSKPFRQENPVEGISAIALTNLDDKTIQVTVTGETNLPTVELFDSEEGLIFSAVSTETSTSPTSDPFPPLQGGTQGGQESQVIPVTGVQLNKTETGIELLLQTPPGSTELLQTRDRSQGNNFIVDIPNAQLSKPFRQPNPVEGISEVSAINFDTSTIRVTAIGETTLPQVELFDSDQGLIFGFTPLNPTPGALLGETPRPHWLPLPRGESSPPPALPPDRGGSRRGVTGEPEGGQTAQEEDIELVVTGEQDTGYRVPDASTATRTDTPIRDIPQSIQVVPSQVIEDQAITEIIDATRNVSGVNIRAGQGGIDPDYNIRGFDNFSKLRNGFVSDANISPNNIERVEVLKGPASVLYGQFEPGGVINYVTKQPLNTPYYSAEFQAGSYSFYEPSFDISGPLTEDKRLRYRLNASYRNTGSFVDFVNREIIQVAPTIAYGIGENTNVTFAYEYINDSGLAYDGLPIDPIIFQVPRDRFVGEPSNSVFDTETNNFNLTLEHQFSENWQIRSGFAIELFNTRTEGFRPGNVEPDGRTLNRFYQLDPNVEGETYILQTDIIGKFKTGPIEHQMLFGFVWQNASSEGRSLYASVPSIDLFDPVYGSPAPTVFDDPVSGIYSFESTTVGLYLQDQITFLPNLKMLIGGRYDFINQESPVQLLDTDGLTPIGEPTGEPSYSEAFSPRIGIVYQPIEPISLYASYSRSFVPSTTRTRTGDLLEPTRGTQYEIGIKTEFLDGRLAATLAAYDITQTNVATPDPQNRDFSIAAGETKSRGIELDLAGEPLPGWNIIASFFVNDSFVSEDNDPTLVDETFINAPDEGASLWTTYELQEGDLKGLGFGFGIFYVGNREVELPNTFKLPSYVRADATIFYRRENWRVGLNFKNLFDKTIYEFQGVGIQVGEPFTVLGTVSVEF